MNTRKPIVIMNWAMRQNKNQEAKEFARELDQLMGETRKCELVVLPSMGTIQTMAKELQNSTIKIGSQTISMYRSGEYSGEYSIESLIDIGGEYVEVGHWERRLYFNETEEVINKKVLLALKNKIRPILCVGEKEKKGDIQEVDYHTVYIEIKRQLFNGLLDVKEEEIKNVVIAYTPHWAVGQSAAAPRDHIHQVAEMIRSILAEFYESQTVAQVQVIYGGTVSVGNAKWITSSEAIDGVLLGRFGSRPQQFLETVQQIEQE